MKNLAASCGECARYSVQAPGFYAYVLRWDYNMAVYLTCSKGRGLHKKHIEVCRKCHENARCEVFLKFCDNEPAGEKAPPPGVFDIPASAIETSYIINELMEIELLLGKSSEKKRKMIIATETDPFLKEVMIGKIKQALKEIRTHY